MGRVKGVAVGEGGGVGVLIRERERVGLEAADAAPNQQKATMKTNEMPALFVIRSILQKNFGSA